MVKGRRDYFIGPYSEHKKVTNIRNCVLVRVCALRVLSSFKKVQQEQIKVLCLSFTTEG